MRGRSAERLVWVRDVLWYRVNKHDQVRLVIVRDPDGVEPDDYFLTTDRTATGADVASRYAGRWSIEVFIWRRGRSVSDVADGVVALRRRHVIWSPVLDAAMRLFLSLLAFRPSATAVRSRRGHDYEATPQVSALIQAVAPDKDLLPRRQTRARRPRPTVLETPRPRRAACLSLWLHALIWCWYLEVHPTGRTWIPRPWYPAKSGRTGGLPRRSPLRTARATFTAGSSSKPLEDPLPWPPYVALMASPIDGVPVGNHVLRSVHSESSHHHRRGGPAVSRHRV